MSSAVFPPPDIDSAHTRTHACSLLKPARSQTREERGGTVRSSESQLSVRSELSPLFSFSTGPWSLHGTPESAAQHTAALCHGLPWRGEPFTLQGSIQIRWLFNIFLVFKVVYFFPCFDSNLIENPLYLEVWGGFRVCSCSSLSAVSAAAAAVTQPRQEMTEQQF